MDLSDFRTQPSELNESTTIEFGEESSISIMPFKNRGFLNYFSKLQKPYEEQIKNDTLPEDIGRRTLARAMAEKMVTKWANLCLPKKILTEEFPKLAKKVKGIDKFSDDDKVAIPYSKENCYVILNHVNYDDFRGWILMNARKKSIFLDNDEEEDLGNSTGQ